MQRLQGINNKDQNKDENEDSNRFITSVEGIVRKMTKQEIDKIKGKQNLY